VQDTVANCYTRRVSQGSLSVTVTLRKPQSRALKSHPGPVELMPGDVAIAQAGDQLKTLLGSCVTVILTDPRRTIGAMCHIVHVGIPNESNRHNTAYGVAAMHEMFTLMRSVGVNPKMCEAYAFGGGNMFPHIFNSTHVGLNNANWALDYLDHHGILIREQDLSGNGYRKVSWTVGPTAPVVETVSSELNT